MIKGHCKEPWFWQTAVLSKSSAEDTGLEVGMKLRWIFGMFTEMFPW
jgi:hypothetical protein